MNCSQFIEKLQNISSSYHWDVEKKRVVAKIKSGPNKGLTLNPVTALAHKSGLGFFENTREETEQAASLIGLTRSTARNIYSATVGTKNRGNNQVIRGKIRSALEV
jgi:hypothetical protein